MPLNCPNIAIKNEIILNQEICFFFPYFEESGVPVLFYRMANVIASGYPSCNVSIIDFENGAMWKNVDSLVNIRKIQFLEGVSVSPPDNSVLVLQAILPYYWPSELVLKPNQRLFFWNLHPHNLVPSLLPMPFLRDLAFNNFIVYKLVAKLYPNLINRLQSYTSTLLNKRALFFMDKPNLELTEKYLFLKIQNRDFMQVPAEASKIGSFPKITIELGRKIRIGWIGRLCDFKSYILVYTVKKINEIALDFRDKNIEFHIVGDGPFQSYIKENLKKFDNISIVYHGSIPHKDIDKFISDEIDIVMAMGTSALEGAKLGKPTFILDPILEEVKNDYFFRMIYDTQEFDLGHFIEESDYVKANTSLKDSLEDIFNNYSINANKSYLYFNENHNLENVKDIFFKKISESQLLYSMLSPNYFKKPLFLKLYNKIRGLKA